MRRYAVVFAALGALLFFSYGAYWSATWHSKWSLIYAFFSVGLSWQFTRRRRWAFPLMATSLVSGAWVFAWNFNPYRDLNRELFVALGKYGATSYLGVLIGVLVINGLSRSYTQAVSLALAVIPIIGIIQTLWSIHTPEHGGFSGNFSMHGCLIAALLPLVVIRNDYLRFGLLFLALLALAVLHASNPFGVLLISWGAYTVADQSPGHYDRLERFMLMVLLTLILAVASTGHPLFDNDGRMEVWRQAMHWWKGNTNHWFGAGLGTTPILMPYIQDQAAVAPRQYVMWLHSDWLQILFELGYIGLASTLLAWGVLAKKAYGDPRLFGSFMGFSAMGLFNYPLHMPIHVTAWVLLIWLILRWDEPRTLCVNSAEAGGPSRDFLWSVGQSFGLGVPGKP